MKRFYKGLRVGMLKMISADSLQLRVTNYCQEYNFF